MKEKRIIIEGQETPYLVRDDGTIWSEKRNRELKGTTQRNAYHTVYLMFNNKQYNFMVHRLVAEYFCENPNNYTIVHHKDGNPHNNRAENLEWVDIKTNNDPRNRIYKNIVKKPAEYNPNKNWKQIPFDNDYLINDEGEVWNNKIKRMLIPSERNGYLRASLKTKKYSIHRLVWETFNGEIPDGYYIDHIDGNRANNSLSNLRLTTQSENMKNAMANGHKGQVPVLQYDKEGNFIKEYKTIQEAADAMNVAHPAIRSAIEREGTCRGFIWKRRP